MHSPFNPFNLFNSFNSSFPSTLLLSLLLLSGCITRPPPQTQPSQPAGSTVSIEGRLRDLNIQLPPYSPPPATLKSVVVVGNLAFVSGHLSRRADNSLITGRVGEDVQVQDAKAAARQAGLGILSSLRHELGSLDRVKRVVKVLGLVNSPPGFADQPAVINGCSELFIDLFGKESGVGARSAVGMSSLPRNAAVEIEAIFEIH